LRVVRIVPESDTDEDDGLPLDSFPKLDQGDGGATMVFDGGLSHQDGSEPPLDDDVLRVVLSGEVQSWRWLRVLLAVVVLLVLGAGVSIRAFRRHASESHAGLARHRIAEMGRVKRKPVTASSPIRSRSKGPSRRDVWGWRAHYRPRWEQRDQMLWSATKGRRPVPSVPPLLGNQVVSTAGAAPMEDDQPEGGLRALHARPPCVPGSLGC
jgi:hypothetical protein